MRSRFAIACAVVALASGLVAAQERYVRAEENSKPELLITTATGEIIVVPKSTHERSLGEEQTAFVDVAISRDGTAVGWAVEYTYPHLVEVYRAGQRHTFKPSIVPWHWCFVDGSSTIATTSSTTHGTQHEVHERWDLPTGTKRDQFIWMNGESYPDAPAWVVALRSTRASRTHHCSTR